MNPAWRALRAALRDRSERRRRQAADLVIVSYPKSGRTWLRVMLGRALCRRHDLPEERLLDTPWLTRAAGLPVTVFCHDGTSHLEARRLDRLERDKRGYADQRVLLLARDPRDVVVSGWYQATRRRSLYRGTLSDFVRDPRHGIRKILTWYGIWQRARGVPRRFEVLRYEDLQCDPAAGLRRVLALLRVEAAPAIVEDAVAFGGFDSMRRMEREGRFPGGRLRPGVAGDDAAFKVRRGVVGGYRDTLAPEDVAYCDAAIAELGLPFAPALSAPAPGRAPGPRACSR